MTQEEKEVRALKWLRYQVNRFMWTPRNDRRKMDMATHRLIRAWKVAEARDTAKAKSMKRPIVKTVRCLVPECDRDWLMEGPRQGFQMAAAYSHCGTHFFKYHEESGHPGEFHHNCKLCHPEGGRAILSEQMH